MTSVFALVATLVAAAAPPAQDYGVTHVRILPPAGHAEEMKGGQVVGSLTSATNDFEAIVEIETAPAEGKWAEFVVPNGRVRAFRFLKYQARNDVRGEVAELEFYAGGRKLTGRPFGTAGAGGVSDEPRSAFDGDPATAFRGEGVFQQYVGLDLGPDAQAGRPAPSIPQGAYAGPRGISLSSATPGVRILYSLDGTGRPGLDAAGRPAGGASEYSGKPILVEKSTILQAVAIKAGLADSTAAVVAYRIGEPEAGGGEVAEFHVGNSLTDTVNDWVEPLAASAGRKVRYYRFTIPGAPTDWLWDHPGSGFGESHYAQAFVARAPLTDLITQPFAGHGRSVDNEAEHSGKFFDLARQHSPKLRMWLYVQWPDIRWDRDSWANGKASDRGAEITIGPKARTWQEAVENHARYTELVAKEMNRTRASEIEAGRCTPVRIVPGGLALARLKTEVEAGRVPGIDDFAAAVFAAPGDFHMSRKGAYLIALVHYACLHGESPEGKVTAAGSGLTGEQARIFQRITWETAKGYGPAGVGPGSSRVEP